MTYVRATTEVLAEIEADPSALMRLNASEIDSVVWWLGAPQELRDRAGGSRLGLPADEECALRLAAELADERKTLPNPIAAIALALGWAHPHEHEMLRWLAEYEVRFWLGSAFARLLKKGFIRALNNGLMVVWRPT